MNKRKINPSNVASNSEDDDFIIIAYDDPRLTDDEKRRCYEIGSRLYGKPDWDIEELIRRKPRDIEEIISEQNYLKDFYLRAMNAKERADAIIAAFQDYDPDNLDTIFSLDRFIKSNPIDLYALTHIISYANKSNAAERARLNAVLKHANDPRQQEKSFIYSCWQSWRAKPDSYKSKAAFAKDMLTKCEHLTSQKKIEDWCREWGKAHRASTVRTMQA